MSLGSFDNPAFGSNGGLVLNWMQSPNFVTGSAGWRIQKDGNVEFNNGIFRGTVTAGAVIGGTITGALILGGTVSAAVFTGGTINASVINGGTINAAVYNGTDFTMGSAGIFIYSGTPATGNLLATVAPTTGTDSHGNAYVAGVASYNKSSSEFYAVTLSSPFSSSPAVQFDNQTNPGSSQPAVFGNNPAGFGQFDQLVLNSGGQTADTPALLTVRSALNSGVAGGDVSLNAGALNLNTAALTGASTINASGLITASGGFTATTTSRMTAPAFLRSDTSWHTPGSLPTGWTGTAQYRLLPDGTVMVVVQCSVGTTSPTGTITLFSGQDANHTASVTTRGPCGYFPNTVTTVSALAAITGMRWSANTTGTITVQAFPGGAAGSGVTEIDFVAIYPALI